MNETQAAPGTTNDDAPFQPGERVEFCGEEVEVVQNFGQSGRVRWPRSGEIGVFYWRFEGEPVRRVNP